MMKIFKSLAIITAVVAIAGGGTYALWYDTATLSGVTYSSDSLDLKIDSNSLSGEQTFVDNFSAPGTFANLKPGDKDNQIIDIQKIGGVAGYASIKFVLKSNDENSLISPETLMGDTYTPDSIWDGELAQNIKIKISYDPDNDEGVSYTQIGSEHTLAELHSLGDIKLGKITSTSGIASVKIEWEIPSDANNKIMTDSAMFDVVFGLSDQE
jgi:predicted ribosomally synthesized peptide with SipW-like signal peptide